MKVSELFESQIIQEGTWAIPDTPAKAKKLIDLLSKPLPGKGASKKLYGLFGDDELFDDLDGLEINDVRYVVIRHLKRLLKGTWSSGSENKEVLQQFVSSYKE